MKIDRAAAPNASCTTALGLLRQRAFRGARHLQQVAGTDAVKAKIKRITCGFGAKRTIALKNGALDDKINFSSVNDYDFVIEYLRNNL